MLGSNNFISEARRNVDGVDEMKQYFKVLISFLWNLTPIGMILFIIRNIKYMISFTKYAVKDSTILAVNLSSKALQLEVSECVPELKVNGKTFEIDWFYMRLSASPVPEYQKVINGNQTVIVKKKSVMQKIKHNIDFAVWIMNYAVSPITQILWKIKQDESLYSDV